MVQYSTRILDKRVIRHHYKWHMAQVKLEGHIYFPVGYIVKSQILQSLKKLSQCLAALQRLMQYKSKKLHNNLKIIYVIL